MLIHNIPFVQTLHFSGLKVDVIVLGLITIQRLDTLPVTTDMGVVEEYIPGEEVRQYHVTIMWCLCVHTFSPFTVDRELSTSPD